MRRILRYARAVILMVILSHAALIVSYVLKNIGWGDFAYKFFTFYLLFISPILILIMSIRYFLGNLNLQGHIKSILLPIAYIIMTLAITNIETRLNLMKDVNLGMYSLLIILGTFIVMTLVSIIDTIIYFKHKKD